MEVELKSISPTSYLIRRYCPTQNLTDTYTPQTYARRYSGISNYQRRDTCIPVGYGVMRQILDTPRSSMSMDRTSLSSDRFMYTRGFSQPPIDMVMKKARMRMSMIEKDPFS